MSQWGGSHRLILHRHSSQREYKRYDPQDEKGDSRAQQHGQHLLVVPFSFFPGLFDPVQLFTVRKGDNLPVGPNPKVCP